MTSVLLCVTGVLHRHDVDPRTSSYVTATAIARESPKRSITAYAEMHRYITDVTSGSARAAERYSCVKLKRLAAAIASVREDTPSVLNIACTCCLTVPSEISSCRAILRLL
jgi:hypothetical protein